MVPKKNMGFLVVALMFGKFMFLFVEVLGGSSHRDSVEHSVDSTLPKTNIFDPERLCLEDKFPLGARPIFREYV